MNRKGSENVKETRYCFAKVEQPNWLPRKNCANGPRQTSDPSFLPLCTPRFFRSAASKKPNTVLPSAMLLLWGGKGRQDNPRPQQQSKSIQNKSSIIRPSLSPFLPPFSWSQASPHPQEGRHKDRGEKSLKANWTLPKAKRKEESSGIVLFHGYASPYTYPPPLFFLVTVSDIFLFLFFEVARAPPPNSTLLLCMGWAWVLKR